MSSNTQSQETVAVDEQLDERDARALTECMTVLADGGSMFDVVGENGRTHTVDARADRCTCRDAQYNLPTEDGRETCKHRSRVAFATGERAIPAWVDMDRVDDLLGEQLPNSEPRVAATDGGMFREADRGRQRVRLAGGVLVYEDCEDELGRRLVGFEDVTDWSALREGLAARGHDVGAVHHKPVLDDSAEGGA